MELLGCPVTPIPDRDDSGNRFLLTEVDPVTFFGVFNRGITNENRVKILEAVKIKFGLSSQTPNNFDSIPVLFNMKSVSWAQYWA